ncbi:MAG: phosphoribosylglycinamide synthetase C domain-containing protein [Patescibacteria group bacterium]
MKILFVSEDLVAGDLARLLKEEGHDVKLYIKDKGRRGNFDNMVEKINSWQKELKWVGKEGLIIFDGCDSGLIQDKLRARGFSVVGSSALGNKLENDREYGNEILKKYKLSTVPQINFDSIDKTISFVEKNKRKWVIKQNSSGTSLKGFNYVGMKNNADDVIDVLTNYKTEYKDAVITLQEKIEGVEIGVGRYFNGTDWVGPIEINLEHKKYFPGDLGPTTSEMGTLAWYDSDENNKIFKLTLDKIKPHLKEIGFKGDMEINCIVNEKGSFPLEATPRFGSPIVHLQGEIQTTPWAPMLKAMALGEKFKVKWKKGYGIVIVVTVPTSQPFPFTKADHYISPKGLKIYFDEVAKKNMEHIHFEDVSMRKVNGNEEYYISDDRGYVLYVTAVGKTVEKAREKAYGLLKHIHIPKMFYRNDIGLKFIEKDQALLKKWGYIK